MKGDSAYHGDMTISAESDDVHKDRTGGDRHPIANDEKAIDMADYGRPVTTDDEHTMNAFRTHAIDRRDDGTDP